MLACLPDTPPVCIPGYGNTACATQCGGVGPSATYGFDERPLSTPCAACASTNLEVNISNTPMTYTASASSKLGASDVNDCLSTWSSYGVNWYLADTSPGAAYIVVSAASLSVCLDQCQANSLCLFATYDNAAAQCRIRVNVKGTVVFG